MSGQKTEQREDLEPGGLKFNLRELGGALGDFGPLHPFFLAYVKLAGLEAPSILLVMGLSNVLIGAYYRLPLPIEPQKAIAIYALLHRWSPALIYATAFGVGVAWLALSYLGVIGRMSKYVPESVARGIQLALAFLFLKESLGLMSDDPFLAGASLTVIALFSLSWLRKRVPATLLLFAVGIALAAAGVSEIKLTPYIPRLHVFSFSDVARGIQEVGVAQLSLTLSNAIIATRLAVNERFSRKIKDGQLARNTGFMNVLAAMVGCIPLCHGAGGFATQYFYGARTGGAMIMEGVIEISAALLFSQLMVTIFSNFPTSIIGAMLLPSTIELGKTALKLRGTLNILTAAITTIVCILTDLGTGFFAGILLYYLLRRGLGGWNQQQKKKQTREEDVLDGTSSAEIKDMGHNR